MVIVYFETPSKSFSEIVAVFDCDRTYNLCLGALEKEAEIAGMIITESCDHTREEAFNILKMSI